LVSLVRRMTWLPWFIDRQLQRDTPRNMEKDQVLAVVKTAGPGPCPSAAHHKQQEWRGRQNSPVQLAVVGTSTSQRKLRRIRRKDLLGDRRFSPTPRRLRLNQKTC
jgi:hypothetical protein